MHLYYQDEWVTLYHGDCRDVLPLVDRVDVTITDPPYGDSTHNGALTLRKSGSTGEMGLSKKGSRDVARKLVDFQSMCYMDLQAIFALIGMRTNRWVISFMERRYVDPLERWCETEISPLRFIREGIYYKPNGAPQVSGDRPAQGWESIAIMHRKRSGRIRWNGGGHDAMYVYNKPSQAKHPTQKPLPLILKMVTQFSIAGEVIFDPFCGSGVIGVAAKMLRRRAILVDQEERYCKVAAGWLQQTQSMMPDLITETAHQNLIFDQPAA